LDCTQERLPDVHEAIFQQHEWQHPEKPADFPDEFFALHCQYRTVSRRVIV
jgi:hypothetical protein